MPPLTIFQALRVLDLEGCSCVDGNSYHLEHLGKLLQLRYLGLHGTRITELPEEIGDLKFLQTLGISQTRIKELPRSVSQLKQLKRIDMQLSSIRVPEWMGNLTSLEDLSVDNVSESTNFLKELGKLTELRSLTIWIRKLDESWKCKAFAESLGKLEKIQDLFVHSSEEFNWVTHVPSRQLRYLRLNNYSSRMPMWINSSLLPHLTHLFLYLKAVKEEDIEILGKFPELLTMRLIFRSSSDNGYSPPCECSRGAFPKLKLCYTPAPLQFQEGAMPSVESIGFAVHVRPLVDSSFDFDFSSLENLPLVDEVNFYLVCTGADAREVEEAEAAVRRAVQVHPNRPFLSLLTSGITYPSTLLIMKFIFCSCYLPS
jgi:hypothetical protein